MGDVVPLLLTSPQTRGSKPDSLFLERSQLPFAECWPHVLHSRWRQLSRRRRLCRGPPAAPPGGANASDVASHRLQRANTMPPMPHSRSFETTDEAASEARSEVQT